MACENMKKNLEFCKCTYNPCSRKGKCCECVQYHLKAGQIPGCFFPKDGEATYDRSIENFIKFAKK